MAEWTTEQIKARIRGEAIKQGLDPNLALAVATQESYLNPNAIGDNGNSLGLFQLQPAAAIDVGVNPRFRHEPDVNIYGGVSYLKQKLTQAKGNVEQALRLYNGGGDPNYVQNVFRFFKPGVAEAAERPQPGTYSDTDVQNALKALQGAQEPQAPAGGTYTDEDVQNALKALGGTPAPPAPAQPAAPTARSTPEQDAAYRAWAAQQAPGGTPPPAPVSQTAPAPTRPPAASQGPVQPITDPAALLAGGGGPGGTPQPVTDPAARLAVGGRPAPVAQAPVVPRDPAARAAQIRVELADWERQQGRPWREGDPLMPTQRAAMTGATSEAPLEEGITKPSTMIPLLMGGAGAKAVQGVLGASLPWAQRLARPVVEGLSQTLGWGTGRTLETGQIPSAGELGKEAALNIATGGVVEVPGAVGAAKRALLRTTPGAQVLLNQRAVQEAKGLGARVFQAQDEAAVSKVFDDVARSGERLDVLPMQDYWTSLTGEERRIAMRELRNISPRYAAAMDNPYYTDWDIGHLQDLRSNLLKAAQTRRTPATQDLLMGMRSAVDDAITNGMAAGGSTGTTAEMLRQAQAAWRKVKQAQDLQDLVSKHTRDSPNLKWQELNLAALNKELRGGGTKAAKNLVAGMQGTEREALQQEMESLARHYPFIRVSDTGAKWTGRGSLLAAGGAALTGNLPVAGAALLTALTSAAVRSPTIMSLFRRSIIEGRGTIAPARLQSLLDAIRHEQEGETPSGTGR